MSLPNGYKRLEYIQSSGTQYIDTGFKPNQNTKIELDVLSAEGTSSNIPYIFGAQDSNNYFVATWVLGYGNGMVTTGINLYDGKFHVVKVENGALYKDGSIIAQRTVSSFSISVTIFLFAVNSSRQSTGAYGACKLRSCKIYNNGMLVRDFIPCKNPSGIIGLWDDVNSVFYQNAGSGTFTSGPEVKGTNKTLIDGTEYDIKAGKCLVGSTTYVMKKGRTLIGGTAYEISFKPSEYTITMTGSGGKIIYNGVEQTETFTVAAGESITIMATAFTTNGKFPQQAIIQLNGTTVSSKTAWEISETVTATYTYTPEQDTSIIRSVKYYDDGRLRSYSTTIKIETT